MGSNVQGGVEQGLPGIFVLQEATQKSGVAATR